MRIEWWWWLLAAALLASMGISFWLFARSRSRRNQEVQWQAFVKETLERNEQQERDRAKQQEQRIELERKKTDEIHKRGIKTIDEMGPTLLSQLLELNGTQKETLEIAFLYVAQKRQLLDPNDLREVLQYMMEHVAQLRPQYGSVSKNSIGVILRRLIKLENWTDNELKRRINQFDQPEE